MSECPNVQKKEQLALRPSPTGGFEAEYVGGALRRGIEAFSLQQICSVDGRPDDAKMNVFRPQFRQGYVRQIEVFRPAGAEVHRLHHSDNDDRKPEIDGLE